MKFVIYYPGDHRYDVDSYFERHDADSKEEAVELAKTRIKNWNHNNDNYDKYVNNFKFSLGEVGPKPEYQRPSDPKDEKHALRKHMQACGARHAREKIREEEFEAYMAKCPYKKHETLWRRSEPPKIENTYEYPTEFWEKFLSPEKQNE